MANILKPNEFCKEVNLYKLFRITDALASRRTSMTIRMPSREDSSRKSVIPSIRLSPV